MQVAVALVASLLAGCRSDPPIDVAIAVDNASILADLPVSVKVTGLARHQVATVVAQTGQLVNLGGTRAGAAAARRDSWAFLLNMLSGYAS